MDNKRVARGLLVPQGRSSAHYKCTNKDENVQFCNRIGCNGRLNYTRGVRIGCAEKTEHPTSSSRSSNGKEIVRTSSIIGGDAANIKFPLSQRRLHSRRGLENDGIQGVSKLPNNVSSSTQIQRVIGTERSETVAGKSKVTDVGSSSILSSTRPWMQYSAQSGNGKGKQNTLPGSSLPSASKAVRSGSSCSLRNLKCNTIADVIPQSGPPTDPKFRKRVAIGQRDSEGESSSSCRGKKVIGNSSLDGQWPRSRSSIYNSDARYSRRWASGEDTGAASVVDGRPRQVNHRSGHSDRSARISSSLKGSAVMISKSHRPRRSTISDVHASYQGTPEASSSDSSSYNPSASIDDDTRGSASFKSTEDGITHFINCDALRQYNVDEIAEVLMELERIEQNEEITYERLLALETNLFLSSLGVYDQHRDMRMDIDNMSYEELLALEERMGTVSTALSEEAISKCLERSIYQPVSLDSVDSACGNQNDKCSICQEEYMVGDETGKLECEHRYHVECIEHWLQLKNWCPMCKGSAAAS